MLHHYQSIWLLLLPFCFDHSHVRTYDILPESFLNQTRLCQINCTRNQTLSDRFTKITGCTEGQFQICEASLTIDFSRRIVSYGFDTADNLDENTTNTSALRADLTTKYLRYLRTNITAIRYRQLTMKFNEKNPHQLNIKYYCRTQIDDCAYEEIQTIYPIYIGNQGKLKSIQPIFYKSNSLSNKSLTCSNSSDDRQSVQCKGFCTAYLSVEKMIKSCKENLSIDQLGINMTLGLAYPNHQEFTSDLSNLILVCNEPFCNNNQSISRAMKIANDFFSATSIGIRLRSFTMTIFIVICLSLFH